MSVIPNFKPNADDYSNISNRSESLGLLLIEEKFGVDNFKNRSRFDSSNPAVTKEVGTNKGAFIFI